MNMTESLERQLDAILERWNVMRWKEVGLEELINYAHKEKEYWESRKHESATNDMIRVIGMAESLIKLKKGEK